MNEWEWQLLEDKIPVESLEILGVQVRRGDRVRLHPKAGGDVFDLALQRIWRSVTTGASTSAVICEDGEALCHEVSQFPTLAHASVAERAVDQNHRQPVTDSIECYRCAVLREHFSRKRRSRCLGDLWASLLDSL